MIGTIIDGKYEIRQLLGQGGMGAVYEAAHTGTGRRCALKVINSEALTKDKNIVGRFQREARAAGAIDTQYIAQVLDAGVDRDTELPFLVVEYLDGEDLQHVLKRVGPLAPDLVLRIAAQVCLGLQKAHAASVVHRDIKPANLFLTQRDAGEIVVKMLDFGIAKVKMDQANSTEGAELTRTGNLLGSPMYMSPEQARGQKGIDHRTDLYSLGAVLYQSLSGRTPFQHATALGELILFVCSEPPPALQDHAPWVPAEVAALVHKCLAKSAAERFQSAEEMFEALQPLLPGGWAIHRDMLVSLEESVRQLTAARLPMSMPPPPMTGTQDAATVADADRQATQNDAATVAMAESAATTGGAGALAHTQVAAADKRSAPWTYVVLGAGLLAAAGAGGVYFMSNNERADAAPVTAPSASSAPTTAAPTSAPSATATASAAPLDASERRVRVVILPKDAAVEVEGKPATLRNGILEITGRPGSVHRVNVVKGTGRAEAEVIVTEDGALPPMIELKPGQVVKIPRADASSAATGGPAAPPPVPKGIDTNVDEFK